MNLDDDKEYILSHAPSFQQIDELFPNTFGCFPSSTHCQVVSKFMFITGGSYSFIIGSLTFIEYIFYYYKERELRKKMMSTKSQELNTQLFRALTVQLVLIVTFFFIPILVTEIFVFFQMDYGNFYIQLALMPILLYPILDVAVLMYFVKPYRIYVKELYRKCLKNIRVVDEAPVSVINQLKKKNASASSQRVRSQNFVSK